MKSYFLKESKSLIALAAPIIANNLAIAGMTFADTVMAGRLSAEDLAAVSVGNGAWMMVFLSGFGILMAMSPIAAQRFGATQYAFVGAYVRQAWWLSQLLALIAFLALFFGRNLLSLIGIDESFLGLTKGYLGAIAFGLPAIYAYLVLRFISEGVGHTKPIMFIALIGLVINIFGNWVFMYGKLGAPELGAVGCGVASAIAMWSMAVAMFSYVVINKKIYLPLALFARWDLPERTHMKEIVALGLPIGGSVLAEAGLFSAVALTMGTLSVEIAGAHQIAITYAALMFMVPLGLHSAITVRVGQAVGANDYQAARMRGWLGMGISTGFMALSAIVMLLFKDQIVALFTIDQAVAAIAVELLFMAAIFQISDGLQVSAAGALRGYKDTRLPLLFNLIGYWVIGFPIAFFAAKVFSLGPIWVWAGLVAGLGVTALLLTIRFYYISDAYRRHSIGN